MKKGFTLIEVIVVLVIISIISLITIPIILNIIDKASYSVNKRNVENYAHSIEIAMAEYKMDHGYYTYDINELNIKYSGTKIDCDIINLNENGSVYVNKCKIDGEYVEDHKSSDGYYHYGSLVYDYKIGDIVQYNNIDFYVLKNSVKSDENITLIKKEYLMWYEINDVIQQTSIYNKINVGSYDVYIPYYSSNSCNSENNVSGCISNYDNSFVKEVVDVWTQKFVNSDDTFVDSLGYVSRLLSENELFDDLDCSQALATTGSFGGLEYSTISNNLVARTVLSNRTFTMAMAADYIGAIWQKSDSYGNMIYAKYMYESGNIRPVLNLKKSAIEGGYSE